MVNNIWFERLIIEDENREINGKKILDYDSIKIKKEQILFFIKYKYILQFCAKNSMQSVYN